jgi:hypothetical protein
MVMRTNLILAATILLMLGVTPSVYAHTQDYMKGYKLGREDGKTGGGGYGVKQITCIDVKQVMLRLRERIQRRLFVHMWKESR